MKRTKNCFNAMKCCNNHNANNALKKAVEALQQVGQYPAMALPGKLLEMAKKGLPGDFQFNQWNIRYLTKDKYGIFCLHWLVSNGISGTQKVFYTKDYVGDRGKIYWRRLAGDMRKV